MKEIYYKILSNLPSKRGKEALKGLKMSLPIDFKFEEHKDEKGKYFIATSINVDRKNIITAGRTVDELEYNLKDAVFTAFKIPKFYSDFNLLESPAFIKNKSVTFTYASR